MRWGLILFGLVPCGCAETFDGNGVPAEQARSVSGFDRVSSRGALDVELSRADAFSLDVRIDANLIQRVSTRVSERTLIIKVDDGNLGDHLPGPHVVVSLPSLRHAELNGSGSLSAR